MFEAHTLSEDSPKKNPKEYDRRKIRLSIRYDRLIEKSRIKQKKTLKERHHTKTSALINQNRTRISQPSRSREQSRPNKIHRSDRKDKIPLKITI